MIRIPFCISLFILLFNHASAQSYFYEKYWIQFKDKNNSPYAVSNPLAYLTERAIERRQRQHIAIDEKDLPVNPAYEDSIKATGISILNRSKWLNSVTVFMGDTSSLKKIRKFSFVKMVSPVGGKTKIRIDTSLKYKDPAKGNGLRKEESIDYGKAISQIDMLHGETLHDKGFRGQGMVIAMLDAGFHNADNLRVFDSLRADSRLLGTRDFVKLNNNVFKEDNHGSECLSTMAANWPGAIVGTAPKASFWLFRTEDAASESPVEELNWAAGAELADSLGADIISSSLGYTTFDDAVFNPMYADLNGHTTPITRAAVAAASRGILVCNSAGNEGVASWHYISAPADADSIITTGAVDPAGVLAPFSSRGPTGDGRIKPDVVAEGANTSIVNPIDGSIIKGDGTSFSNPIMAGMSACLWQAHPDKTNQQIINAIKQSASLSQQPNNDYGWGIPNFALADLILTGADLQNFNTSGQPLIFPNPVRDNGIIVFNATNNDNVTFNYFDMLGRLILVQNYPVLKGVNQLRPNLSNIPAGQYVIRMYEGGDSKMIRVVKI